MRVEYLSYSIQRRNPVYGLTEKEIEIESIKSIAQGDSCNVYRVCFENHWGTHVDGPAHFFLNGKRIAHYNAEFWHFTSPQVIPVNAEPGQIISMDDLLVTIDSKTDLLLLQSGWSRYRGQDSYSLRNPGLSPEIGFWLRKERLCLRAIGFDFVSVSSFENRELGRIAHRAFLDPDGYGNPIVIIEDMCLQGDMQDLKEVWVAPLLVDSIDSAPCTVLGVFK